MMLVKLLGAASGYALAWMVTQNEGAAAYGRFELGLTVLSIGALAVRLGLDGVMVKWLASARAQGLVSMQRKVAGRAVLVVLVAGALGWFGVHMGAGPSQRGRVTKQQRPCGLGWLWACL